MTRATVALALGLALMAVALALTLTGSPLVLAGSNSSTDSKTLATTYTYAEACQAGEALPAGTSAIRLAMESGAGPRVNVTVRAASRVLTGGTVGSGWKGAAVTVAVKPVAHPLLNVSVCFALGRTEERVELFGTPTRSALAARNREGALPGRVRIEYLRAAPSSWWSLAPTVARHLGLGREPSGTWLAWLLAALMAAVVATASWLTIRELR